MKSRLLVGIILLLISSTFTVNLKGYNAPPATANQLQKAKAKQPEAAKDNKKHISSPGKSQKNPKPPLVKNTSKTQKPMSKKLSKKSSKTLKVVKKKEFKQNLKSKGKVSNKPVPKVLKTGKVHKVPVKKALGKTKSSKTKPKTPAITNKKESQKKPSKATKKKIVHPIPKHQSKPKVIQKKFKVIDHDKERFDELVKKMNDLEKNLEQASNRLEGLTDEKFRESINTQLEYLMKKLQYKGDVKMKIKRAPPKDPIDFRGEIRHKTINKKFQVRKINQIISKGNDKIPKSTSNLDKHMKAESALKKRHLEFSSKVVQANKQAQKLEITSRLSTTLSHQNEKPKVNKIVAKTKAESKVVRAQHNGSHRNKGQHGKVIKRHNRPGLPKGKIVDHIKKKAPLKIN